MAKKAGKYANAPKSEKKSGKSKKKEEEVTAKTGAVVSAETAEELTRRAEEARASARIGRPVPEMYPDIVCTYGTNESKIPPNARQLAIENLTVQFHGKELIVGSDLTLSYGNRYGLVGLNGSGKSTLLRALASGMIPRPKNIDVYTVERGIDPTDKTALQAVLEADVEKLELETEADLLSESLGDETLTEEDQFAISDRLTEIYDRLDELGAETAEVRAASILDGLGFTPEMQQKCTKDFSGGWRMRIALARALYINPSFLILDEPTNHLDMGAVVWFEEYLKKFDKILLLVSHSQDFLNGVCSHIILLRQQKLTLYSGNYDTYVQTRSDLEVQQQKKYEWEQQQIADMKEYIARFGHGSAKLARQAQSKEKTLEKMVRSGLTEKVTSDKTLTFRFHNPIKLPPPVIMLNDVGFAYPDCELLYSGIERGLDCDSRVCLVGPNGAGKSTLLKLLLGDLVPTVGMIRRHLQLRIASYHQHTVDQLPFDKTPLEFMHSEFPRDLIQDRVNEIANIRSMIGRFGITGAAQTMKISQLSDGQRARICFAHIAESRPHIIFLDEPTNALDPETIDALADAIKLFEGGVIVVSHDIRLISQVAKEIWLCDDGKLITYPGSIEDFKKDLQRQVAETGSASNSTKLKGDGSKKTASKTDKPSESSAKSSIKVISGASAPPKAPKMDGMTALKRDGDIDDIFSRRMQS